VLRREEILRYTEKGYMAMTLAGTERGDKVAVLHGIKTPFIVREVGGRKERVFTCTTPKLAS